MAGVDNKSLQPFGLGPQGAPASPREILKKGEKTVTMVFPHKVRLQHASAKFVDFPLGIQEVPEHLADHDWLKRNGVVRYDSHIAKDKIAAAKTVDAAEAAVEAASADLAAANAKAALVGGGEAKHKAPKKAAKPAHKR